MEKNHPLINEESPLSSKVAMFNNAVSKHQESQHLNPFSQSGVGGLPKPTFKKGEYGKPLAGSLTEQRGQKANIHVLKEMLELCQIIDSEGYDVKDEPEMKVIPFGELFNIYTYISDKVVGILLRARKHKLVEFEGEVLFQHRDEDVPVFLLKPIKEIRQILTDKQDEIRRSVSPAPQATSVIMDQQKTPRPSPSPSPKPKASTTKKAQEKTEGAKVEIVKPIAQKANPIINVEDKSKTEVQNNIPAVTAEPAPQESKVEQVQVEPVKEVTEGSSKSEESPPAAEIKESVPTVPETIVTPPTPTVESAPTSIAPTSSVEANEAIPAVVEEKPDVNNNNDEAPAIIVANEISSIEDQSPADTGSATTTIPNTADI
ncbi:uncharacterized protein LOC129920189 isoform X2 [Episyrphus balteatus]|uniref:uncharacterized protein LOC129920189 isoform X2 n=1 Tax=Episyrphus balteatus TaxID=286459 RepID=UPI0024853007|nr:uncharacterized protein LOC129920189 isoform X2 [Episyrphus balteatus]